MDGFEEVTPVMVSGPMLGRARREAETYERMGIFSRWLSRIRLSPDYLATWTTDQVFERAFTPSERTFFQELQRDCQRSYEELRDRANAHISRLGIGYRDKLRAEIVRDVVRSG